MLRCLIKHSGRDFQTGDRAKRDMIASTRAACKLTRAFAGKDLIFVLVATDAAALLPMGPSCGAPIEATAPISFTYSDAPFWSAIHIDAPQQIWKHLHKDA